MTYQEPKELLFRAINAAVEAGNEIMEVYDTDFAVESKDDNTPLTLADKRAHNKIMALLESTNLPVLSEEGRDIPYAERSAWKHFWMVDPLDGTKEFVKRNGEFTVNIALIENGVPIAGVIYVPVTKDLYFAWVDEMGAYKVPHYLPKGSSGVDGLLHMAIKLPTESKGRQFTVVGSRSHMSPETGSYLQTLEQEHGEIDIVSMGSSLKICLVAEGVADIYPRFAPTMEWDTAAGHAIANAAGKEIIDHVTGLPMRYNKENLLNNWFVVS